MKGTIVKCLEELVVTQFGKDKWEKSLEDAGLKKNTMFFTVSDVDDAMVMKVVGAVCTNLGISLSQAADAFGDYWVNTYSQKMYGQFFQKNKTAKEFMLDMDNVHVIMTKTMKDAKPPRFSFEWKDDKTLVVNYNSDRGLIDFAVGLTKGVGKYYNEQLRVSKLNQDKFQVVFA
jgi:hypothetical protein